MSHKTLIIYQNKILFNILNELYLKQFSIILTDKKSYRNLSLKDKDNYLVITNENDLDFEHKLVFNNFPLKIKKILDSINISFLKNSYKLQSEIKIGSYVLNINSKEICSTNKKLFLTEREANLILFLNKSNTPVNINELQKEVWGHLSKLETHTVETHIYRLRKKIKEIFNDDNFIISTKDGYKIN